MAVVQQSRPSRKGEPLDMPVQILFQGPLTSIPQNIPFKSPVIGPVAFYVSGSGYLNHAGLINFQILLDDVAFGAAVAYVNGPGSHQTLVSGFFIQQMNDVLDVHTLGVEPLGAISDEQDCFTVSMVY